MLVVLYNVRTRALHRHPPYLDLWEWLWWTGLITFSMMLIEAVFSFDFILVLATPSSGWARSSGSASSGSRRSCVPTSSASPGSATSRKQKFADPEATIRRRTGPRRQRRRRR